MSTSRYLGQRIGEHDAVISGIGRSQVGRKLGRTGLSLSVESALAAIEDAGLTRDDIDGLSTYPGLADASPGPGLFALGAVTVLFAAIESAGLKHLWWSIR